MSRFRSIRVRTKAFTVLLGVVFSLVFISGCATTTAPTSPSIQRAFLANFDLVDKEKVLYQGGVIDINCRRCRNGTLILTDKGIYLFAQKRWIQPLTPSDFTVDNLYLSARYTNVVGLEKPDALSGFFGDMILTLEEVTPRKVIFAVGGTAGSNKPYNIISEKMNAVYADLEKVAREGDPEAQYELGRRYYTRGSNNYLRGEGIATENKDIEEAQKWYRKAAEQGHIQACITLGDMYFTGTYVWKDIEEAAKWYLIASDQGNSTAQAIIERIKKDYPEIWNRVNR